MPRPFAYSTELAPRLRSHLNPLLTPVVAPAGQDAAPASRKTKRGTTIVSYAEDLLNDDFEDSDGHRRLTGLRTRREDSAPNKEELVERLTTELVEPISVQGIWREWMGRSKPPKTDKQLYAQAGLPTALVPIRIDLEIPSFTPEASLPVPEGATAINVNTMLQVYRPPAEPTTAFRLKDYFLWNLHESLITPDMFALQLVSELDLPNQSAYVAEIAKQIRDQLSEYAGVALHPLFQTGSTNEARKPQQISTDRAISRARTPATPATPLNGTANRDSTPAPTDALPATPHVEAIASLTQSEDGSDADNPDDAYRCIITLNVNILNRLFTDKFEWSLLHPPGFAELFASHTCADMGLSGEWVPAISHAIYESVLRLRKEALENQNLPGMDVQNESLEGQEAGWRYDPETLGEDWEPKVEMLSKEEIERREGDRERQLRRARRETARFSTNTNFGGAGTPGGYFDQPDPSETLGRGERSKKKRRFRSLSPAGRGGTPADGTGFGGGSGQLGEHERPNWRCSSCSISGLLVWAVRDGPLGPRTLCSTCGLYWEKKRQLPPWTTHIHYPVPHQ